MKQYYPERVFELRETLFDKLDAFKIPYKQWNLFRNILVFVFESIWVKEENLYKGTETTKWITEHVPISVSISTKVIHETISLCKTDPNHLFSLFFTALGRLATPGETQMIFNFTEVETAIKIKLCGKLEQQPKTQRSRKGDRFCRCLYCWHWDLSTQILQMQEEQSLNLQKQFERYCKMLPIFGFKNARYDINLIKYYLLPILVNERDIETTVIKEVHQFVPSNSVLFSLLTLWVFSVAALVSILFSKPKRLTRQSSFSPMKDSIVKSNWTAKNFLRMTPTLVFCVVATPSKKITSILKNFLKVAYLNSQQ